MFTAVVLSMGLSVPSGNTLLALLPLLALIAGLVIYCLIDLIRAPAVLYLPKLVWAVIIIFVSAPIGPLIYLVLGRDRHGREPSYQ